MAQKKRDGRVLYITMIYVGTKNDRIKKKPDKSRYCKKKLKNY